jgi:hypothetical protein
MATYNVSTVQELIDAIIAANNTTTADTIVLAPGVYDLSTYTGTRIGDSKFVTPGSGMDDVNGLPIIQNTLTIKGNSSTVSNFVLTRGGSALFRLVYVPAGASLTVQNLTVSKGEPNPPGYAGGAIYNKGTLTVTNCVLGPNNRSAYGGAVRNDGTATLTDCDIWGNVSTTGSNGAGVYNEGTLLTVRNCVVRNNDGANGAGLMNSKATAYMTVDKCVIKNNTGVAGAGVACYDGQVTVSGSILYGNRSGGGALYARNNGTITANGNNLFDNSTATQYAVETGGSTANINAKQNWWGRSEGALPTELLGNVDAGEFKINPVLTPTYLSGEVAQTGGTIKRGPSAEDLDVPLGGTVFPIPVRAKAFDEADGTWYGFEHPNRTSMLSWLKSTDANLTGGVTISDLPNLSIPPDNGYSDSLIITGLPLNELEPMTSRVCRGFALFRPELYSSTGDRHPGFDFFPPLSVDPVGNPNTGREALAVAEGIVVGIGKYNPSNPIPPANWGAVGDGASGFNLVIRANGYFLLYGHLASVNTSLYLGARVRAGDSLGTLAPQSFSSGGQTLDNTHLHLEVRVFSDSTMQNSQPIWCRFGAVKNIAAAQPEFTIDPMKFVSQKGTPTLLNEDETRYTGGELRLGTLTVSFDYDVDTLRVGKCFRMIVPVDTTPEEICPPVGPNYC